MMTELQDWRLGREHFPGKQIISLLVPGAREKTKTKSAWYTCLRMRLISKMWGLRAIFGFFRVM